MTNGLCHKSGKSGKRGHSFPKRPKPKDFSPLSISLLPLLSVLVSLFGWIFLGNLLSFPFEASEAFGETLFEVEVSEARDKDLGNLRLQGTLERLTRHPNLRGRHVLFFHWDAARSDLTEAMLRSKQLPFLEFLLQRGRLSLKTLTVDKSETMSVIPKYLASKRDLDVVGWWQFNRENLEFHNFGLVPEDALDYLFGLSFPRYPTIMDFLDSRGESVVGGFCLYTRGMARQNYGRAYREGLRAFFDHTHLHQAQEVTTEFLNILRRIASNPAENFPLFSFCVLTALDEFAHIDGVSLSEGTGGPGKEAYFFWNRKDLLLQPFFEVMDEAADPEAPFGTPRFRPPYDQYVIPEKTRWYTAPRKPAELCVELPLLEVFSDTVPSLAMSTLGTSEMRRSTPRQALSMMFYDMQLGRILDLFYAIRKDSKGKYRFDENLYREVRQSYPRPYLSLPRLERGNSLLENTLFFVFGDHGMVDSQHMMAPNNPYQAVSPRSKESLETFFIDHLNRSLGLSTWKQGMSSQNRLFGCDDRTLPEEAAFPFTFPEWQNPETANLISKAYAWAEGILKKAENRIVSALRERYWWIFPLWSPLLDAPVKNLLTEYGPFLRNTLIRLRLRGVPFYQERAREFRRSFYDKHIRLIHGGGVRNNAELYLPGQDAEGNPSWKYRPSLEQIAGYVYPSGKTLLEGLETIKGVGLIFIRRNNQLFSFGEDLPEEMFLLVRDRYGNQGEIRVRPREDLPEKLEFAYSPLTERDPLGYFSASPHPRKGNYFSFEEWNDFSVEQEHYYPNIPGGMGAYLYSTNPALGDVLVMHSQGWNFGAYAGNHGGIHRGEKRTFLLVSGPTVTEGPLMARDAQGKLHYPTLLDMAPTALEWLGYGPKALTNFSRGHFAIYLEEWRKNQRQEATAYYTEIPDFPEFLEEFRLGSLKLEDFRQEIFEALEFMDTQEYPPLPNYELHEEDGLPLCIF